MDKTIDFNIVLKHQDHENPYHYTERDCVICKKTFFSDCETFCDDCRHKDYLRVLGYSEDYIDQIIKTHVRFDEALNKLLSETVPDEQILKQIIPVASSILVKCHCNALEVGWNEGYQFAREQPREFSSNIDIPGPITPKADEIRRDSRIVICDRCEGTGKVRVYNEDPGYSGPGEEQCPICNGKGRRNLLINFVFSPIKDI